MTVLETRDLKKYYGAGDTLVKALDGVDLQMLVMIASFNIGSGFSQCRTAFF